MATSRQTWDDSRTMAMPRCRSSRSCLISTRQRLAWPVAVALLAFAHAMIAASTCQAFTLTMSSSYQPPLKSITDRRRPSRSSSTYKSAYAGALAVPAVSPLPSFEERMRQLVVGTSIQAKPKVKSAPSNPALPSNVITIKTLSEFRDVVANEKEKTIAVRFHATWCKVSHSIAFPKPGIVAIRSLLTHGISPSLCLRHVNPWHPPFTDLQENTTTPSSLMFPSPSIMPTCTKD